MKPTEPDTIPIRQLINDVGSETALKLLGLFENDVHKRLAFLQDYQDNGGETDEVRRHAHSLKGLCRTYGAVNGGDIAERLQLACDANALDEVPDLIAEALHTIPADVQAVITAGQKFGADER